MTTRSVVSSPQKTRYRPDIDGLRAIAVFAVVLYHLHAPALPSGFLGVDIFFVISGFVVTQSLVQKPPANWADYLWGFYARRIKRLMPALMSCVGLTSLMIVFIVEDPETSLRTGMTALVGTANMYLYAVAGDYFGQRAELNPFTQTWSLAVEEQFYLGFPLLLAWCGLTRDPRRYGNRVAQAVVGAAVLLSLLAYLALRRESPSAAFYWMPARFWQLGLGALVFMRLHTSSAHNKEVPVFTSL